MQTRDEQDLRLVDLLQLGISVLEELVLSPTVGVSNARCRIPRDRDHLVVALLNPYRVVVVEVNDCSQRHTAVEPVLYTGIARIAGNATLYPGVASPHLCFWDRKVLHHSKRFRMLPVDRVQEAVSATVFVGVTESQLISDRVFLQKREGATNADVIVRSWKRSGPVDVRANHHKEVGTGAGTLRVWTRSRSRRLSEADWRRQYESQHGEHCDGYTPVPESSPRGYAPRSRCTSRALNRPGANSLLSMWMDHLEFDNFDTRLHPEEPVEHSTRIVDGVICEEPILPFGFATLVPRIGVA